MRTISMILSLFLSLFLSLILSFFLSSNLVFATPTDPVNDKEYITLKTPQPVPEGKKIEVIEFFMYHCPACNMLDAPLDTWVKKQGDHISFKRIHVPRKGPNDVESHLFLTLQALNKEDALHKEVLKTWHEKRIQLQTDDKNIDWAVQNGIDKDKFVEAYNSFSVDSKLKDLSRIVANYQVESTPTIVVDGRYQTNMARVSENNPDIARDKLAEATLQVVSALIEKARANKVAAKP